MKKVLLVMMLVFLVACGQATYESISPEEAYNNLQEDDTIILLDVRTQLEYDEGHIPGAMLLTLDFIGDEAEEKLTDKSQTIYVYCRSGRRSEIAVNTLLELGYENIYDLGGIINWPYEIE